MSDEIEKNNINQEITPEEEPSEDDPNTSEEVKNSNLEQITPEEQEANKSPKKETSHDYNECIKVRLKEFNGNLNWKESLLLKYVEEDINLAYYQSWLNDANMFFKRAALLKKRLKPEE